MRLILSFIFSFISLHAIVTIVPQNIGEKPGYTGILDGSLGTKRGNTEKDEYTAGVKFQYDNAQNYLVWLDVSGSYAKASGKKNTQKSYAHVRLIHTLYENLTFEAFLQSQNNKFTNIKLRSLSGVGVRYHINNSNYGELYTGLGVYYENINYSSTIDPIEKNARINLYIAYVKKFQNKNKIAYVAYYQPKPDDFNDYVTTQALQLEVNIFQKLYLKFKVMYYEDSIPAIGIKRVDFTQKTSLTYKF